MYDDELARAASHGDEAAFATLLDRNRDSALRIAYAIANGEAEDVAQDAAAKAFRCLHQYRADRPFRPWYLAIVANEARNRRRSFRRRAALSLRVAATSANTLTDAPDAADEASRSQRRQYLLDAVARLSASDRQIIGMRYFAEMTESEVSLALGIASGTVKSRLSRALLRLRRELGEDED